MKNVNQSLLCMACMNPIEIGQNYVRHHVTYYPETIITVHTSCHGHIHNGKKYPQLIPDFRESLRWARKHKQNIWTWEPYTYDYFWLCFMDSIENGFMTPERKERIEREKAQKLVKDYWDDVGS